MNRTRSAVPRRRDPSVRRPGIVYGFNILDPDSGKVLVDYVGQTVQELGARERQHRGQDFTVDDTEQPWSDLIVGKPVVLEEGLWTAAELDEREQHWIRERVRPRYNHEFNLDNPNRIPIYEARRQREERDRAAGRVSPTWGRTKAGSRPAGRSARDRTPGRVVGTRFEGWLLCLLVLGPVMGLCGWLVLAVRLGVPSGRAVEISAAVTLGVFAVSPLAWWLFRQSRRRTRRKVVGWSAVGVAVGLLWLFWPLIAAHLPWSVPTPVPTRPAAVTGR